ncbi:MAG: hypothetical protein AAF597_16885 [Bacteroidota bacterium]
MSQSFKCKVNGESAVLSVAPEQVHVIKKRWFGPNEVIRSMHPASITELEWRMGKQGTDEPNFFITYTDQGAERVCALSVQAPGLVYAEVEEIRPSKDLGRQHGDVTPADLPTHDTRAIHPSSKPFGPPKPPAQRRVK